MASKTKIVILGITGSIGDSTLKVLRHHREKFEVIGIAAGRRWRECAEIAAEFKPKFASVAEPSHFKDFSAALPAQTKALCGVEGMVEMCSDAEVDTVLCAVVGTQGLLPVLAAVRLGKRIALASKEIMVMAGEIVAAEAQKHGSFIIPVDSEHSAVFQCLDGKQPDHLRRIILTCSGGPFLNRPAETFSSIRVEDALKHPTWEMGRKITVDSATLMNKALELIEARWLFSVEPHQVEATIHPQAIVHSLVEFTDGTVLAQMSEPDMVFPIQYAFTYPERFQGSIPPMDFTKFSQLTFDGPDHQRFPSIRMAHHCMVQGGAYPAVFNAANEVAVEAFLKRQLPFVSIWKVIEETLQASQWGDCHDLESIIAADAEARKVAQGQLG